MKSNELEPNWRLYRHSVLTWSGPETSGVPGASEPNSGDSSWIEMSTSVERAYAHFKVCKVDKVAIFYGIVLIPLVR